MQPLTRADDAETFLITSDANVDVVIAAKTDIILAQGNSEIAGSGNVTVSLLPEPHLRFNLNLNPKSGQPIGFGCESELTIPMLGISGPIWLEAPSLNFQDPTSLMHLRADALVGVWRRRNHVMTALRFHLINFMSASINPIVMEDGEWHISLNRSLNYQGLLKTLNQELGYAFTHDCTLEMSGKNSFERDQTDDLFESLHYVLSFARGRYVSAGMMSERSPTPHWDTIGVPHICSLWSNQTLSWNPNQESSSVLSELFSLFRTEWKTPETRALLKQVLFWYVSSNLQAVRVSGGILLSHFALERLAWQYFRNQGVSRKGITSLNVADQLRMYISSLGLSREIPSSLTRLHAASTNVQSIKDFGGDLAAVLVSLRNNLAHPEDKHGGQLDDSEIHFEAWNAYQWLLELGILRLIGYRGLYRDRLILEELKVSPVPWH